MPGKAGLLLSPTGISGLGCGFRRDKSAHTSGRAMAKASSLVGQPCPPDLPDSPEVGVLVGVERSDLDRRSQGAPPPPFVWFLLDLEVADFARVIVACVNVFGMGFSRSRDYSLWPWICFFLLLLNNPVCKMEQNGVYLG